jgi:hypothetical protein
MTAHLDDPGPDQRRPASLFEPAWFELPPVPPPAPRRRPRAWLPVALAVTLTAGFAGGFALGSVRAGGEPAAVTATSAPAAKPPPAPVTSIVVRRAASSACLETATRADQLIELLVRNRRREAADLLVAYTVATRQCRRDASP